MDDLAKPVAPDVLTIRLQGTIRGKTVASLAHAYAMTEIKMALPPAVENAPWRTHGGKDHDYFKWRKAMVEEHRALELVMADLLGGEPVKVGAITWPVSGGKATYMSELATSTAQAYARTIVKALGL